MLNGRSRQINAQIVQLSEGTGRYLPQFVDSVQNNKSSVGRVSGCLNSVNYGFAHTAPKAQWMAYYFEISYSKLGFGESYSLIVDVSSVSTHKKLMSKKQ